MLDACNTHPDSAVKAAFSGKNINKIAPWAEHIPALPGWVAAKAQWDKFWHARMQATLRACVLVFHHALVLQHVSVIKMELPRFVCAGAKKCQNVLEGLLIIKFDTENFLVATAGRELVCACFTLHPFSLEPLELHSLFMSCCC